MIAETLPDSGREETSGLLNHKISLLARSSASTLQPVVVAETNRDFDRNQDVANYDPLPNPGGVTKLAVTQSKTLHPLLDPLQNHPSK